MPGVAFIPNVHIADSLRTRTLINSSAVLYEQAAAQTSLPAEVSNIDLNFVPSVAFIPDVHIADSLRARTLINPSTVLYEQAAARTGLPAEVSNISSTSIIDLNFMPSVTFNAIGNVELTGDLLGNADRVNNNNNNQLHNVQERTASPAKRIKTNEDRKKSTHRQGFNSSSSLKLQKTSSQAPSQTGLSIDLTIIRDNIEKLIYVSKVKHTYVQAHTVPYPDLKKYLSNSSQQGRIKVLFRQARNNRNNLNIIVTNLTSREFSRLLQPVFKLQRYNYYNPQDRPTPREPGSIYVLRIVSKSDKVPTREPSSYIKTELYPHQKQALYFMWDKEQDYSAEEHDYRKFYRLIITSKDTHYKQTIKKAYIMSPERASLILFIT
ncbi:hypothetical protein HBI15_039880 [Parastagonospora nodorum]|nr:hypothetical protein HBI15_039880 [Parastagonospora nodorum]